MTAPTVGFGIRLPAGGPLASPGGMARVAQESERLGYSAVWVHDFLVWTRLQDRTHISCGSLEAVEASDGTPLFYESLTNLAWLAGITTKVDLGVAVLCLPYREPVAMAKQLSNIDNLSDGRLILGIGPGGAKDGNNVEFEVLDVPRIDKHERSVDYFKAMTALWTEEAASYHSKYTNFENVEFFPKPIQKPFPRTWGVGRKEKALRMTAQVADGWIPSWVTPSGYRPLIDQLQQLAGEYGRRNVNLTIANDVVACIAETHEAAVAASERTLSVLSQGYGDHPPTELIRAASLIGSTEEVAEQVNQFVEAGVTHFELRFIYHTVEHCIEQMQLFADRVAPKFAR